MPVRPPPPCGSRFLDEAPGPEARNLPVAPKPAADLDAALTMPELQQQLRCGGGLPALAPSTLFRWPRSH